MAVTGYNGVIDISHYQSTPSRAALEVAGIVGIIHKATQGRTNRDITYFDKKQAIKSEYGLKWGSYHFTSGSDPIHQFENYIGYAQPEADEIVCIDFEPSSSGPNMTYDQLVELVELVYGHLGRYPMIYGGAMLREAVKNVTHSVLSNCPLWYSRYNSVPAGVPKLWPNWTLWQYTDGNVGPLPHDVPGFGRCDRDTYNGTRDELLARWPFT